MSKIKFTVLALLMVAQVCAVAFGWLDGHHTMYADGIDGWWPTRG